MNRSELPRALQSGSPALFRRTISLSLRRWRLEAGLTQSDAAYRLARTDGHISNIESDRTPSAADMEILLTLYGKDDHIPFMRALLDGAKSKKGWWNALSGDVPSWFNLFLGLEDGAGEVASFDSVVVPGLLQTDPYAEAVIRGNPDLSDEQVRQLVNVRMGRQQILEREENPIHVSAVIDESVLYRQRGTTQVMEAQLNYLLEMSKRPRIDIQILPYTAGSTPAQDGSTFTVLTFPPEMVDDPGLVYVELLTGGKYFEKPAEVSEYRRALTRLRALAANPQASRGIIRQAMKEVRQ
ncbi:MAG: helix-turn-helix domain-containing protein [Actinomycetota bacterium]|nr:helix-turn-helix domain-containing protein [Actinomycetota bacterium]